MVCRFCTRPVGLHEYVIYGPGVAHEGCANDFIRTYEESDEERFDRLEGQEQ